MTGAAITAMTSNENQVLLWASDGEAARIDELQFRLGEGPCVEAFESRAPVLIPDITQGTQERWPVFAAAATRDTSARGMYVFPLLGGPISIGVLDFYRDRPGGFSPEHLARARSAAQAAFWTVLGSRPARGSIPTEHPTPIRSPTPTPTAGRPISRWSVGRSTRPSAWSLHNSGCPRMPHWPPSGPTRFSRPADRRGGA